MLKATTVVHDIRVAHGDEGRRLAPMQAPYPAATLRGKLVVGD